MGWLEMIIVACLAIVVLFQAVSWLRVCRAHKGRVASLEGIPGVPEDCSARLLLYFYSQDCSYCRTMNPVIDALCVRYRNIVKVNALQHYDVARRFKVRGFPCFLLMEEGRVTRELRGFQPSRRLEELLQT